MNYYCNKSIVYNTISVNRTISLKLIPDGQLCS
jgi:hypothetical protein